MQQCCSKTQSACTEMCLKNNLLNCWKPLRALLPKRSGEQLQAARFENDKDWAISSQASNRGRFRDYPVKEGIQATGILKW